MTPIFVYKVGAGYVCRELGDEVDKPPGELVASISAKGWIQYLINETEKEQINIIKELKGEK